MNILFVCYTDFRANSLVHIAGFASGLRDLGHSCAVAIPAKPETISAIPAPAFVPVLYAEALASPALFPDGRPADLIHAWTPRWHVADFVLAYQRLLPRPARLIVHLEDNEEHLAACITGRPFDALRELHPGTWVPLRTSQLVHPRLHRLFLHAADAITHITPALASFAPAGRPVRLLRPGVEHSFFSIEKSDTNLRRRLSLPPGFRLVVYPGGINRVNAPEVRDLYAAVALLNETGIPARLVRSGRTPAWFHDSLSPRELACALELGYLDRPLVAPLVALADVLVQPGRPGPFNDYRLPSKLAEFLASGRPVVMPATNVAAELEDGRDALFLKTGAPEEIAARCRQIFADPDLARRLGASARSSARRLFEPERQCALLAELYAETLARPASANWPAFTTPGADERALFPLDPADADLAATLRWLDTQPRPPRTATPTRTRRLPRWISKHF